MKANPASSVLTFCVILVEKLILLFSVQNSLTVLYAARSRMCSSNFCNMVLACAIESDKLKDPYTRQNHMLIPYFITSTSKT